MCIALHHHQSWCWTIPTVYTVLDLLLTGHAALVGCLKMKPMISKTSSFPAVSQLLRVLLVDYRRNIHKYLRYANASNKYTLLLIIIIIISFYLFFVTVVIIIRSGTDFISLLILFFFLLGRPLQKSPMLRHFKSDRDEICQECSSGKYALIQEVWFSIWCHTFKMAAVT